MANVSWIKLATDTFKDEKLRLIKSLPEGRGIQLIWIQLLTEAGRTNDNGYVYLADGVPYTSQMLSVLLEEEVSIVELALQTFIKFRMIKVDEKGIMILNWEKHQNVDGLDRIRKQNKERVQKYRERKKQEALALPSSSNDECNVTCNVTVTHGNAIEEEKELDKDKERDKEKDLKDSSEKKSSKSKSENLTSLEDIETFVESKIASNHLDVDFQILIDYIDCLRLYRKTARISIKIINTLWDKWTKFHPTVVAYAMQIHVAKHDDKSEEYTLAIMHNTNEHKANQELNRLNNKGDSSNGYATNKQSSTGYYGSNPTNEVGAGYYSQFDGLFANSV